MHRMSVLGVTVMLCWVVAAPAYGVYVPPALSPGDTYQLVFVTSRITDGVFDPLGDGSGIATANAFVQAVADASVLTAGVSWFAVISDATQDARDLFPQTDTSAVFNLQGDLLSPTFADMWDGSLDSAILYDESAALPSVPEAWTGTDVDGTAFNATALWIANSSFVVGSSDMTDSNWIFDFLKLTEVDNWSVYGISEELTKPIPEPASAGLLLAGLGGLLLAGGRRRMGAARGRLGFRFLGKDGTNPCGHS